MNEFDNQLRSALSAEDQEFVKGSLEEKGYYAEVFGSMKGPGATLNIMVWIAVLIFSALLIFFLYSAFHAETTRSQILFASLAIMANSGQIAFQLWLNMRMHRRSIEVEILKLKLAISHRVE